ncbi:MAG: FG-GAP repeat domain-containing protein [Sandaracinaceae bacterium]
MRWRSRPAWLGICLGILCLGILCLGGLPRTAHAQPDTTPDPESEPDAPTALGHAVADRAHGLGGDDGAWCVRVSGDVADEEAARWLQNTLARAITTRLTALGHEVHHVGFRGEGEEAARAAHRLGYARLLDVRFSRQDSSRASHSALQVESTLHQTAPSASLDSFRRAAPLDVALRTQLGWMPPVLTADAVEARSGSLAGSGYLAMGIVDLDGDRRGELITVSRRGVQVFSVEPYQHARHGHRLRTRLLGEVRWPDALPPAASRRRRVVASVAAEEDAAVVRTSEHAHPVRIRWRAGAVRVENAEDCDGFLLDAGCARLVDGRDFFDETFVGDEAHVAAAHFYMHRQGRYTDREGITRGFEALITTAGRLSVRTHLDGESRPRSTAAVGYGVALAMSDLDLDGRPELLASHASAPNDPDQLTLLRARGRGALRVVWRGEPTRGPLWAAASGDIDGDGLDELLAIEGPAGNRRGRSRLWMVR